MRWLEWMATWEDGGAGGEQVEGVCVCETTVGV